MEILSGMFLAILLLQYTVRGYLPGKQCQELQPLYFPLLAMTILKDLQHLP